MTEAHSSAKRRVQELVVTAECERQVVADAKFTPRASLRTCATSCLAISCVVGSGEREARFCTKIRRLAKMGPECPALARRGRATKCHISPVSGSDTICQKCSPSRVETEPLRHEVTKNSRILPSSCLCVLVVQFRTVLLPGFASARQSQRRLVCCGIGFRHSAEPTFGQRSFNWQSTAFVMRMLRVRVPPLALGELRVVGCESRVENSSNKFVGDCVLCRKL